MNLRPIMVLGLLCSMPAQAEIICDKCEYVPADAARYLGAYWPGDKGTFGHHDIRAHYGYTQFDNYFVFRLHDAGTLTVVISSLPGQAFDGPNWALQIFDDIDTSCGGISCTGFQYALPALITQYTDKKRMSARISLVPGKYVMRLASGTRAVGETAYVGKLSFAKSL